MFLSNEEAVIKRHVETEDFTCLFEEALDTFFEEDYKTAGEFRFVNR